MTPRTHDHHNQRIGYNHVGDICSDMCSEEKMKSAVVPGEVASVTPLLTGFVVVGPLYGGKKNDDFDGQIL